MLRQRLVFHGLVTIGYGLIVVLMLVAAMGF